MQEFEHYKLPIIGGILGLVLACLVVTLGFFKTLLLLVLVAGGVCAGFYLQQTGLWEKWFKK